MNRDRTHHDEHELDPPDFADSLALLDDGQVCAEVEPLDDWDDPLIVAFRKRYRRMDRKRWDS
jgi:hypothetical protein